MARDRDPGFFSSKILPPEAPTPPPVQRRRKRPPALESAGRKLVNSEYASGGETNEWKGTAELLVVAWLA